MATALLIGVLAPAAATATPLQMRGFRGLMWGDPPAYLGAAEVAQRDGEVQCYRRERENLLFGDSELRSVLYCFHRDKLFMVAIDALVDADTLRSEFERGYGPPDLSAPGRAHWGTPTAPVSAELVSSSEHPSALLRLQSRDFSPSR
jgi:hypothetical protein